MDGTVKRKEEELILRLSAYEKIAVAFSGGVDSTYLLAVAVECLPKKVIALTAKAPIHTAWESEFAQHTSMRLGAQHYFLQTQPLELDDFTANTPRRCYYCKKHMFSVLWSKCRKLEIPVLVHGANADDVRDYRPGFMAADELKVAAPLLDVGLTKSEIRLLSRQRNLPTWNKPAMACLATRIPYGQTITRQKLQKITAAEAILLDLGFLGCRVRWHAEIARIEAPLDLLSKLLEPHIRPVIVKKMKTLGFRFITLDLNGYIQGSMNQLVSDTDLGPQKK